MQRLSFLSAESGRPKHLLFLGAHSDDIEIGCGGTILELLKQDPTLVIHWIVFSASSRRREEALFSANLYLKNAIESSVTVHEFRDGFFPYIGSEIKDVFEGLKAQVNPDVIFTHYCQDLHQDHRLLCELTWNTFRDHLILEYEIPKYDGDLGNPNIYIPVSREACQEKTANLVKCFQTQGNKHWFSEETFTALMRLRGIESRAADGYAEAFYGRKVVL